jgi:hypothetical protein
MPATPSGASDGGAARPGGATTKAVPRKTDKQIGLGGRALGFTNAFKFPDGRYVKVGFIDANGNGIAPPDGASGIQPTAPGGAGGG